MATDNPTATTESEQLAQMVLSLPPREKAIVKRMLKMLKNWPPDRPHTYTELVHVFKAAGASPADIAKVSGASQEEVQS